MKSSTYTFCKHFRGTQMKCAADVNVRKRVGGDSFGWAIRTPCRKEHNINTCDKREFYTAEELKEIERVNQKTTEGTSKALRLILLDSKGKKGIKGVIKCPACDGVLHYSIAECNGHIWGKCETENCLKWMM